MIFHIATAADWEAAVATGADYRPESLSTEGYVHCSMAGQVAGTLAGWFAGRVDLVLLQIDPGPFGDQLVIEGGSRGEAERFPHIYGPIPVNTVRSATPLECDAAGIHELPAEVA